MIDTGANVSLIDRVELNRIQAENKTIIPTLPINNIILIGATGRQNKKMCIRDSTSPELKDSHQISNFFVV